MTKSIGDTIIKKREAKGLSREELAKKIKITPGYLGHVERNDLVQISPRLVAELKAAFDGSLRIGQGAINHHNEAVRKWKRKLAKRAA